MRRQADDVFPPPLTRPTAVAFPYSGPGKPFGVDDTRFVFPGRTWTLEDLDEYQVDAIMASDLPSLLRDLAWLTDPTEPPLTMGWTVALDPAPDRDGEEPG